jgi:Tol biopolymer transport system component
MAMFCRLATGAMACVVVLSAAPNGDRVITVAQQDRLRAVKAPRTVDVSGNGRFVAFQSWARLVAADDDALPDVYVLDRLTGRVTLESGGADPATENSHPRISGDGRFVVFESRTTREDHGSRIDIVLRDREASVTRALTANIQRGNVFAWSRAPDISDDGRRVAFSSAATTLTPGADANGALEDVYVIDLATGTTIRASVNSAGVQPSTGTSILPSLSTDGTIVAFASTAALDSSESPATAPAPTRQIYVRDLNAGTTMRVSRGLRGGLPDGDSSAPSISDDGRYVVYVSEAANITAGDDNRGSDVFFVDRDTNTTVAVSRAADGSGPNGTSGHAVISGDGRFVAFQSDAGNLTCTSHCPDDREDINLLSDVFVWDRSAGVITRASEDELGGWMEWSAGPAIDRSGQAIAFSSRHPMDAADRGEDLDLFVRSLPPPARVSTARK